MEDSPDWAPRAKKIAGTQRHDVCGTVKSSKVVCLLRDSTKRSPGKQKFILQRSPLAWPELQQERERERVELRAKTRGSQRRQLAKSQPRVAGTALAKGKREGEAPDASFLGSVCFCHSHTRTRVEVSEYKKLEDIGGNESE